MTDKIQKVGGASLSVAKAPAPTGKVKSSDLPFMRDLQEALIEQKTPFSLIMLYLIGAILIIAIVWAKFARVEEITLGEGRIIPASREQIIQSLEGGILEELNVREGDIVEKGQVLLKIDPTRAGAVYREGVSKVIGLKGTITRLRAEAYGTPLVFPADVMAVPSVVKDETQAYSARKQTLDESVKTLQTSLKLAEDEINLSEPLMQKGLMSEVELLRMRRQANEFRLQIAERQNRFRSEANAELNKFESELAQSVENVAAREDVMNRTTLEHISADTLKDEEKMRQGRGDTTYYRVLVRTDKAALTAKDKVFPIMPGMIATVEIRTGEKTILDYILKPVLKAREAFRER